MRANNSALKDTKGTCASKCSYFGVHNDQGRDKSSSKSITFHINLDQVKYFTLRVSLVGNWNTKKHLESCKDSITNDYELLDGYLGKKLASHGKAKSEFFWREAAK